MAVVPTSKRYTAHIVLVVCAFLAVPLWQEFYEPGQPVWDTFLAICLFAIVGGSFFGIRHLQKNAVEVGEARFPPPLGPESSGR